MEATKAKKNASLISHINSSRAKIKELINDIERTHKSAETDKMIERLTEADHYALDRLVDLGMEIEVKEAK